MIQVTKLTFSLILTLAAIAALTPLAIDMYLPAMPQIADELSVSSGAIQLTLTAYTAGFALAQLIHGPLSDSFGRKPVLMVGLFIFIAMSILSALVNGIVDLTWARAIQGVAGASASVVIQAIVRDMFEKEDYARTMSFVTLAMMIAPLLAPLMGGYLSVWFGWRSIFWVLTFIAILTMLAAYIKLPETLAVHHRQSFSLRTSFRHYLGLFKHTRAMGLILTGSFSFACLFTFLTGGAFVYINLFGIPVEHVGYLYGLNIIFMVVMTTINGQFVKRQGSVWMLQFALSIHFCAGILLLVGQLLGLGLWSMLIPIMMLIGSLPVIGSNSMALLLTDYPHIAGTAVSLAGTFRFGAGALAAAIISMFAMTTVWPMVIIMVCCSSLSFLTYWFGVKNNKACLFK